MKAYYQISTSALTRECVFTVFHNRSYTVYSGYVSTDLIYDYRDKFTKSSEERLIRAIKRSSRLRDGFFKRYVY